MLFISYSICDYRSEKMSHHSAFSMEKIKIKIFSSNPEFFKEKSNFNFLIKFEFCGRKVKSNLSPQIRDFVDEKLNHKLYGQFRASVDEKSNLNFLIKSKHFQ